MFSFAEKMRWTMLYNTHYVVQTCFTAHCEQRRDVFLLLVLSCLSDAT